MESFCELLLPKQTFEERQMFSKRLHQYEKELIPEVGRLYQGIDQILQELLKRGFTLVICSNGRNEYLNVVLDSCGIKEYFHLVKGRDLHKTKSQLVADLLQELEPGFAVMVGDTSHDLEAARKNQIPAIGVSYGFGRLTEVDAEFLAREPEEILFHLNRFEIFQQILQEVEHLSEQRSVLVGINGVDTSGKSQFSRLFAQYLRARGKETHLIHLDDFHHSSQIRKQGADPIESYIQNAFNLPLLEKELLVPIREVGMVDRELTLLDLDTDTYTNQKRYQITPGSIVLLEGVLLYRDPIDSYFDYRIFLDISFEEVLRRAEIRDVPKYGREFLERYKVKYIPIQQRYLQESKAKERCNCLIKNNDYHHPVVIKHRDL